MGMAAHAPWQPDDAAREVAPHRRRPRRLRARAATPGRATRAALTLLCCFGLLFAVAARQAHLVATGYQLDRLRSQVAAERAELERLRAELARLSAPGRLDVVARHRLGMRPAERLALARVQPLAPAARAPSPAAVATVPLAGEAGAGPGAAEEGALAGLARWLYRWLAGVHTAEARTLQVPR